MSEQVRALDVSVLMADLRGFTALTATQPPQTVFSILDRLLVRMSEVAVRNSGTIDKFMGDAIMVLFGAPIPREDDVRNALRCAVEMQLAMVELNDDQRRRGLPDLYLGIGINTGPVMAGVLGSRIYSTYTVIGAGVNLAARIEQFSLRGQVLISEATYERSRGFATTSMPMEVYVKGDPRPVGLRELRTIPSLGIGVPEQEVRTSPRVAVELPATYEIVRNKIVLPGARRGRILDMGYHGILAELEEEIDGLADLKLDLDLSVIGHRAPDVYGKAVRHLRRDGRALTGIEFTSVTPESDRQIRRFVQLLMQGSEER